MALRRSNAHSLLVSCPYPIVSGACQLRGDRKLLFDTAFEELLESISHIVTSDKVVLKTWPSQLQKKKALFDRAEGTIGPWLIWRIFGAH
jgi:hypothetical protein